MSPTGENPQEQQDLVLAQKALAFDIITKAQLSECLDLQERLRGLGAKPKPLSAILVEKGYLSKTLCEKLQQGKSVPGKDERLPEIADQPPADLNALFGSSKSSLLDNIASIDLADTKEERAARGGFIPGSEESPGSLEAVTATKEESADSDNFSKDSMRVESEKDQPQENPPRAKMQPLSHDYKRPQVNNEADATMVKTQSFPEISGYKILQKLGGGAMGTVYKGIQLSMDRPVAIKILEKHLAKNTEFVERFMREAQAVARLNHENIVAGIDAGQTSTGAHYFIMEFVEGEPLSKTLDGQKKLQIKDALEVTLQVAKALEHAHKHGIIHRDIKPENIMLTYTESGVFSKLCDLGLAREEGATSKLTVVGATLGTPNYISPEQAKGEKNIDIRSDIYSLGASFYHMLTGSVPFPQTNPAVVCAMHVTKPFPDPRELNPEVPEDVCNIIKKCTEKKPKDRYQKPTELINDIDRALISLRKPLTSKVRKEETILPFQELQLKEDKDIAATGEEIISSPSDQAGTTAALDFVPIDNAGSIENAGTKAAIPQTAKRLPAYRPAMATVAKGKETPVTEDVKKSQMVLLGVGIVSFLLVLGSVGLLLYPWLQSKIRSLRSPVENKPLTPLTPVETANENIQKVQNDLTQLHKISYDIYSEKDLRGYLKRYDDIIRTYEQPAVRKIAEASLQTFYEKLEDVANQKYAQLRQDVAKNSQANPAGPLQLKLTYDIYASFPEGLKKLTQQGKKLEDQMALLAQEILKEAEQEHQHIKELQAQKKYQEALKGYEKIFLYILPHQKGPFDLERKEVKSLHDLSIAEAKKLYAKELYQKFHEAILNQDYKMARQICQDYQKDTSEYGWDISEALQKDVRFLEQSEDRSKAIISPEEFAKASVENLQKKLYQTEESALESRLWALGVIYLHQKCWQQSRDCLQKVEEESKAKAIYLHYLERELQQEQLQEELRQARDCSKQNKFSEARKALINFKKTLENFKKVYSNTAFVNDKEKESNELKELVSKEYLRRYAVPLYFRGHFSKIPTPERPHQFAVRYSFTSPSELEDFIIYQPKATFKNIVRINNGLDVNFPAKEIALFEMYWKGKVSNNVHIVASVTPSPVDAESTPANVGLALYKQDLQDWKMLQRYLCLVHFNPYVMCKAEIYLKAPDYKEFPEYQAIFAKKQPVQEVQAAICFTQGKAANLRHYFQELLKDKKQTVAPDVPYKLSVHVVKNELTFEINQNPEFSSYSCSKYAKGFAGVYSNSNLCLSSLAISGELDEEWLKELYPKMVKKRANYMEREPNWE